MGCKSWIIADRDSKTGKLLGAKLHCEGKCQNDTPCKIVNESKGYGISVDTCHCENDHDDSPKCRPEIIRKYGSVLDFSCTQCEEGSDLQCAPKLIKSDTYILYYDKIVHRERWECECIEKLEPVLDK